MAAPPPTSGSAPPARMDLVGRAARKPLQQALFNLTIKDFQASNDLDVPGAESILSLLEALGMPRVEVYRQLAVHSARSLKEKVQALDAKRLRSLLQELIQNDGIMDMEEMHEFVSAVLVHAQKLKVSDVEHWDELLERVAGTPDLYKRVPTSVRRMTWLMCPDVLNREASNLINAALENRYSSFALLDLHGFHPLRSGALSHVTQSIGSEEKFYHALAEEIRRRAEAECDPAMAALRVDLFGALAEKRLNDTISGDPNIELLRKLVESLPRTRHTFIGSADPLRSSAQQSVNRCGKEIALRVANKLTLVLNKSNKHVTRLMTDAHAGEFDSFSKLKAALTRICKEAEDGSKADDKGAVEGTRGDNVRLKDALSGGEEAIKSEPYGVEIVSHASICLRDPRLRRVFTAHVTDAIRKSIEVGNTVAEQLDRSRTANAALAMIAAGSLAKGSFRNYDRLVTKTVPGLIFACTLIGIAMLDHDLVLLGVDPLEPHSDDFLHTMKTMPIARELYLHYVTSDKRIMTCRPCLVQVLDLFFKHVGHEDMDHVQWVLRPTLVQAILKHPGSLDDKNATLGNPGEEGPFMETALKVDMDIRQEPISPPPASHIPDDALEFEPIDVPIAVPPVGAPRITVLGESLARRLSANSGMDDADIGDELPPSPTASDGMPGSPLAESPLAESPLAESPLAESPLAESPLAESPMAESPMAESPMAESPMAESPVAESPVAESPVAESPVAESPVAESPVAESPVPFTEPRAETPIEESPGGTPIEESPGGTPIDESPGGTPIDESPGGTPIDESPGGTPTADSPEAVSPSSLGPEDGPQEESYPVVLLRYFIPPHGVSDRFSQVAHESFSKLLLFLSDEKHIGPEELLRMLEEAVPRIPACAMLKKRENLVVRDGPPECVFESWTPAIQAYLALAARLEEPTRSIITDKIKRDD